MSPGFESESVSEIARQPNRFRPGIDTIDSVQFGSILDRTVIRLSKSEKANETLDTRFDETIEPDAQIGQSNIAPTRSLTLFRIDTVHPGPLILLHQVPKVRFTMF